MLLSIRCIAWYELVAAWKDAYLPTLEDILWIVAMNGFTNEVAPFMNLSKATRECNNLQGVMREVKNKKGVTQLWDFCEKGLIASVSRMLEMRNIDVEARAGCFLIGHAFMLLHTIVTLIFVAC